jgi:hypothetical protein
MLPRTWTPGELSDPDRVAAEGMAQLRGVVGDHAPGRMLNREAVDHFTPTGTFTYRGRRYTALPVGYLAGVDLQLAQLRAIDLRAAPVSREAIRETADLLSDLARIFDAHARPMSLWRRLLRPVLGNPFRSMTESEAGQLHNFFSGCRTRSSVTCDYASAESRPM